MTEAMIEVRDLARSFGKIEAVRGVTFHVERGEYFGFLGPNGAGKSTTLRILTTLLKPSAGTARVAGFDTVADADDVRARIGLVSDKMVMYTHLTARENLRFFGRLHRVDHDVLEARIDDILRVMQMEKWADSRMAGFSTGMRQRMNLARALVTEPDVLFLDEPTLGLDPQSTREVREFTRRLNKERGTTIILTTHQMSEAELLCDRVAVIDHGQIIACDTPRALKDAVAGGSRRVVDVTLNEGAQTVADVAKAKGLAVGADVTEGHVRLLTDAPLEDVLDVVRAHGRGVTNVGTNEPSLEDVFLHLTGREMRDSAKPPAKPLPLWVRAVVKWKTRKAMKQAKAAAKDATADPAKAAAAARALEALQASTKGGGKQ